MGKGYSPIDDGSSTQGKDGIADYNDVATGVTPINLVANTWTTITNDGAGAFTNLTYAPDGVTQLMNTGTGAFDFTQLQLGDNVFIRNDYEVTPNVNNANLKLRYDLGQGTGIYTLETQVARLDDGSGKPYRYSLVPNMIYMGDLNTQGNPIVLQLNLSSNGTVRNFGSAIGIVKR